MLLLLSPSKTLDFSEMDFDHFTKPRLQEQSEALVGILKEKSAIDLKDLMDISDNLAELNQARYQAFEYPFNKKNAKPSIYTFKGDVYSGLEGEKFSTSDLEFAQKCIRILSGLYGVLRPMDLMQPYRLEMGTRLENEHGNNLYEFWGDQITTLLNEDITADKHKYVINLASKEYFSAVQPEKLSTPLIEIAFKENRGGKLKVIAFNAKKARGAMARLIVKNKTESPEALKDFDVNGYLFNEELSSESELVFTK